MKATAHGPSVMATGPINPAVHKVSDFAHVLVARCLLSIERPRNKLQEVTGLGPVLHDLYPVEFTLFLGPCCNVHISLRPTTRRQHVLNVSRSRPTWPPQRTSAVIPNGPGFLGGNEMGVEESWKTFTVAIVAYVPV